MTQITIKFITIDPHAEPTMVQATPTELVYAVAKQHVGKNHRLILIANGVKIKKTATVESVGTDKIYYAWRLESFAKKQHKRDDLVREYFRRTGRFEFAAATRASEPQNWNPRGWS